MLSLSGQLGWDQECHAPKLLEIVLVRVGPVVSSRSLFSGGPIPKQLRSAKQFLFKCGKG